MKTIITLVICLLSAATSFAAGARVNSDLSVKGNLYLSDNSSLTTSNGLLINKGTWSSEGTYSAGDVVQWKGSSYVCTSATIKIDPSDIKYWSVLASTGPQGPAGATGPQGPAGATGPQGPTSQVTLATLCTAIGVENPIIPSFCHNYATVTSLLIQAYQAGLKTIYSCVGDFNDASSRYMYPPEVDWNSSNPSVAAISYIYGGRPNTVPNVIATPVSLGTTTITVTFGNISKSTSLTISQLPLNPIGAPINPSESGQQVVNLQDVLLALLERGIIRSLDAPNQPTIDELLRLSQALVAERAQSFYGEATMQLILFFQIQQGFGDRFLGAIEVTTAARINEILNSLGLLL